MAIICTTVFTFPIHEAAMSMPSATAETLSPVIKSSRVIMRKIAQGEAVPSIISPKKPANVNILQLEFVDATEELAVFTINTTVGLLGLFEPAQNQFGLESHQEDFGQTLGYYGVGSGCHVVLPFFGPSNIRDIVGLSVDMYGDPISYDKYDLIDNEKETLGIKLFEKLNNSPRNLRTYETIKDDAVDLYPYLRDIYEQRRDQQIKE